MVKLFSLLLVFTLWSQSSFAEWDPYSLEGWLKQNLYYQPEKNNEDIWKSPTQTLKDNGGDCEDFAILVHNLLKHIAWTEIVLIKFHKSNIGHSITVFQESDGTFSYFSNTSYFKKNSKNINDLLDSDFSNWQWAEVVDDNEVIKTILYKDINDPDTRARLRIEELDKKIKEIERVIEILNADN